MKTLSTPSDALPLLACKIAPRQFDLSYRFSSISLRDQIVRAQTLIRALLEQRLVTTRQATESESESESDNEFQLLIVGAGAAGLAAASEASTHGISFVLIEKEDDAPGGILRSSAARYVSTAMYEWPHPNHAEHEFPLTQPHLLGQDSTAPSLPLSFTEPVKVKVFGEKIVDILKPSLKKWKVNYKRFSKGRKLFSRELFITSARLEGATKGKLQATLNAHVNIHGIPLNAVVLPEIALEDSSGLSIGRKFKFKYIVYAVGFGIETKNYADNKPPYQGYVHCSFWDVDSIPNLNLGFSQAPMVGILGSGDGAMQDALRCLVNPKFAHPLAIWNEILECHQGGKPRLKYSRHVDKALARVAAADVYTTAGAIWSHRTHVFESLDQVFKDIVSDLYKAEKSKLGKAIGSMLRRDIVGLTIVTRHSYFTKAYALNRFLVYLFYKVLQDFNPHRFTIESGEVISFAPILGNQRGAVLKIKNPFGSLQSSHRCDLAIIRGGLDNATAPTQLVGLTGMDTGRAELGRIPSAIRPIGI